MLDKDDSDRYFVEFLFIEPHEMPAGIRTPAFPEEIIAAKTAHLAEVNRTRQPGYKLHNTTERVSTAEKPVMAQFTRALYMTRSRRNILRAVVNGFRYAHRSTRLRQPAGLRIYKWPKDTFDKLDLLHNLMNETRHFPTMWFGGLYYNSYQRNQGYGLTASTVLRTDIDRLAFAPVTQEKWIKKEIGIPDIEGAYYNQLFNQHGCGEIVLLPDGKQGGGNVYYVPRRLQDVVVHVNSFAQDYIPFDLEFFGRQLYFRQMGRRDHFAVPRSIYTGEKIPGTGSRQESRKRKDMIRALVTEDSFQRQLASFKLPDIEHEAIIAREQRALQEGLPVGAYYPKTHLKIVNKLGLGDLDWMNYLKEMEIGFFKKGGSGPSKAPDLTPPIPDVAAPVPMAEIVGSGMRQTLLAPELAAARSMGGDQVPRGKRSRRPNTATLDLFNDYDPDKKAVSQRPKSGQRPKAKPAHPPGSGTPASPRG